MEIPFDIMPQLHVLQPTSGKTLEQSYEGNSYTNEKGNAECVEFIKQTLKAPATRDWKEGKKVIKGDLTIPRGTAIATFVNGKYSHLGAGNQHATIYLNQNAAGINVLEQWKRAPFVNVRNIPWNEHKRGLSNDGSAFSVIEW